MSTDTAPVAAAPSAPVKNRHGYSLGTGRRKTSVARVRVKAGSGEITINGRPLDNFFPSIQERKTVLAPLDATGQLKTVDVFVNVRGGGLTGQSGAIKMGIARALIHYSSDLEATLRQNSLLTRDSRMKERKKYGLRGARRGTQFSKR